MSTNKRAGALTIRSRLFCFICHPAMFLIDFNRQRDRLAAAQAQAGHAAL